MASVNVNGKVTDSYYRYKMPKIQSKIEGRGNGIKTVVANLAEVSKSIKRPPEYSLKYLGCDLGAQTIVDSKNERYILTGSHSAEKLQSVLYGFIEKYVLCSGCGNPETNLCVLPKKEIITLKCIACGHSTKVSATHRLSTYILKNPPKNDSSRTKSSKKSVPEKTAEDDATLESGPGSPDNNNQDDEGDDSHLDVDVSESAVKKRHQMLSSHLRALTIDNDMEKPMHERLEILEQFVKEKLSAQVNMNNHYEEIQNEIKRLEVEHKSIFAISSALLDQNIMKQLGQHHLFLSKFCEDNHRIQKYFLGSIERVVEQHMEALSDKVSFIFKIIFDTDIVDEEVFEEWYEQKSSRFVSKETFKSIKDASFKFMEWLRDSEEESDEDDKTPSTNCPDSSPELNEGAPPHHLKCSDESSVISCIQNEDGSDINIDDI